VLVAASTMAAVKPHVPLRAVMAGRTTTAELHAFVRMLLVDALRGAVRNDNGVTDIDEVPTQVSVLVNNNLRRVSVCLMMC